MSIKQIITGHINEVLNKNEPLHIQRMEICKTCPLYKQTQLGPSCNPTLYLNVEENIAYPTPEVGRIRGCGCRLNAKTRLDDAHCPASKW